MVDTVEHSRNAATCTYQLHISTRCEKSSKQHFIYIKSNQSDACSRDCTNVSIRSTMFPLFERTVLNKSVGQMCRIPFMKTRPKRTPDVDTYRVHHPRLHLLVSV